MGHQFRSSLHCCQMRRASRPWRLAMAALPPLIGAFLMLGLSGPSVAALTPAAGVHPEVTTCTDTWKAAVSGLWTTAANWSTGIVPTSSDNVCITLGGSYTVTIEGTATAATVTVGGTAGTQLVSIEGAARAVDSSLTLSANRKFDREARRAHVDVEELDPLRLRVNWRGSQCHRHQRGDFPDVWRNDQSELPTGEPHRRAHRQDRN